MSNTETVDNLTLVINRLQGSLETSNSLRDTYWTEGWNYNFDKGMRFHKIGDAFLEAIHILENARYTAGKSQSTL